MIKRILRYFKKPSPIKDEIIRRDQYLWGNLMRVLEEKEVAV